MKVTGNHPLAMTSILVALCCLVAAAGCSKGSFKHFEEDGDAGGDGDTDSDADSDGDGDTDGDCDLDVLETFTVATLPEGWHIDNYDNDAYGYTWVWASSSNTTGGDGGYWWVDSTSRNVNFDDRLITATHEREGCSTVVLSFDHDYRNRDTTDSGRVDIQVGEGEWQSLQVFTEDASGAVEIDLTPYLSYFAFFRVRFRYIGNNDYYWKVDNVRIQGDP